jgi:ATP-binding cassette subfamily B multidrug efflux pump
MRKIIKYLRPFTWSIIAIFILLFAQALADLSLPGYMSNIVNRRCRPAGGSRQRIKKAYGVNERK